MYRTKLYGLSDPDNALEIRQHDSEVEAREYVDENIGPGYTVDIEQRIGLQWVVVASLHY